MGFILAAAGSAIGLGNIWKFPYVTGENGGGLFVIIYLVCIAFICLPVMMAEIFMGRHTQRSGIGAFRMLGGGKGPFGWGLVGWLGVLAAFLVLSFYSVVGGWSLHYVYLSASNVFSGSDNVQIEGLFGSLIGNSGLTIFWHAAFMALTIGIVLGGIQSGIERWSKILMPLLLGFLMLLLIRAVFSPGFGQAMDFVFSFRSDQLTAQGVLAALGQAFFSLSLGMGAMIAYGSYLDKQTDVASTSVYVALADTAIALLACMVLFPITFSQGLEPTAGPGLVFVNIPIALRDFPPTILWSTLFFLLLTFAAITSAISLLEVVVSNLIDEFNLPRTPTTIALGVAIGLFGIPSALSNVEGSPFGQSMADEVGYNWFDLMDNIASNWFLPIGGLTVSIFVVWVIATRDREVGFETTPFSRVLYQPWLWLMRIVVPIAILVVFINVSGVLKLLTSQGEEGATDEPPAATESAELPDEAALTPDTTEAGDTSPDEPAPEASEVSATDLDDVAGDDA